MHEMPTMTGIPIEWLFGAIGFLLAGIYADIKRDLRNIKRAASNRDRVVDRLRIALCFMARTLKVPFAESILSDMKDSPDDTGENPKL
jgi:hypothetical protein